MRLSYAVTFAIYALAHSIRCQAHRQDIKSILVVYQRVGRTSGWAVRRLVLSTPLTLFQRAPVRPVCMHTCTWNANVCVCGMNIQCAYVNFIPLEQAEHWNTGITGTLEHWNNRNNWNYCSTGTTGTLEQWNNWGNWNTGS